DLSVLEKWRSVLEPEMIDPRLNVGFDAAARLLRKGKPLVITPADPGDADDLLQVGYFRLKRGRYGFGSFFDSLWIQIIGKDGSALTFANNNSTRLAYRPEEFRN